MSAIFIVIGLMLGGVVAWKVVTAFENSKYSTRLHDLESRIRYGFQESAKLKETLAAQTGELIALKEVLTKERSEQASRYLQLGDAYKNALIITGFSTFVITFMLAASISGYTVNLWAEARHAKKSAEMNLDAHLYQHQKKIVEERVNQLEQENQSLRLALQDVLVDKEVVLTKLKILLESLSFEGGVKGFVLDYPRLRKNLQDNSENRAISQKLTSVKSLATIP